MSDEEIKNNNEKIDDIHNDDEINLDNYTSLTPHKYPFLVLYFISLISITTLYSFYLLPTYFATTKILKNGKKAYFTKNYHEAINCFKKVLLKIPSSQKAKISIAKAYFATQNQENYILALKYLQNIEIESEELQEIKLVMPKQLLVLFEEKEKKG